MHQHIYTTLYMYHRATYSPLKSIRVKIATGMYVPTFSHSVVLIYRVITSQNM